MSNATNTTNTAAASGATELIREMQENVAKYGGENTTTLLMVQAIEKLQRMSAALAVPAQSAAPAEAQKGSND